MDRDLEAIILTCLEKEPEYRYATADDLADDLQRWLDGELPRVRQVSALVRMARQTRRFVRRHRGSLAGLALLLALLGTLAVLMAPNSDVKPHAPTAEDHEKKQREEYLNAIHADLRNNKEVILVGATGKERPYPFQKINEGNLLIRDNSPLIVEAFRGAFVTLLPDAGVDSYRLEAQVRGMEEPLRVAGLFAGYVRQPGPAGGDEDWSARFTISEPAKNNEDKGLGMLELTFNPNSSVQGTLTHDLTSSLALSRPLTAKTWHLLVMEVRPREIRAYLNGQLFATRDPTETNLSKRLQRNVVIPPAAFSARAALGLFVQPKRTQTEFKNVTIKPLPVPDP